MRIMVARFARYARFHIAAVILAAVPLIWGATAGFAGSDRGSPSRSIAFDIPAQPLVAALHDYGRRVGVQVLYDSRSATGRQSVAIKGLMTPDEALKRLLGKTDLEVRHANADAITLVAPASLSSEQDLPPADPMTDADLSLGELRVREVARPHDFDQFADYGETVRTEIQHALLKNSHSATGNYRAVLDLWIGPNRAVQRVTLIHPTGDETRDLAITTTLRGLTISRPTPADVPQPIRAVVAVSTYNK